MTTVPNTSGGFGLGVVDGSDLNSRLCDPVEFLLNRPIFRGRSTASQSVGTGSWTSLALAAEDVDSADGHDNATNNTRYTAVYAGWYQVSCVVGTIAGNVTGRRGARFAVNGTLINASRCLLAATTASAIVMPGTTVVLYLNVGDYVEAQGFQDSGGPLNFGSAAVDDNSMLNVVWESN